MDEPKILLIAPEQLPTAAEKQESRPRRPHSWRRKFHVAFRGIKWGARGQSSFFVHFFFAALVITAATILGCSLIQWCILIGCIGLVLTAELFNSVIEILVRGLDEQARSKVWPCLDIAAGAVLMACITAGIIGSLILLYQLAVLLRLPFMSQ